VSIWATADGYEDSIQMQGEPAAGERWTFLVAPTAVAVSR
jgi:hypothetical protein